MSEKICPKCNNSPLIGTDTKTKYLEFCNDLSCGYNATYIKQDFVNNFECPECGSLSGTLEENNLKLGVRCNKCDKLTIMLEKNVVFGGANQQHIETPKPKCPKCGCTEFTPVRKKFSLLTGFATNKVELVCNNCGYRKK